jgi:hypothetical protein
MNVFVDVLLKNIQRRSISPYNVVVANLNQRCDLDPGNQE